MKMLTLLSCTWLYLASLIVAKGENDSPLLLIYETDPDQIVPAAANFIFQQIDEAQTRDTFKDNVEIVGNGEEWKGWGSKAKHISQKLSQIDPNRLVVVSDSRDVLLNNLNNESVDRFVKNYQSLTNNKKDAIVLGAESQCCVSAMTHAKPGDFINDDLTRTNTQACNSGKTGCKHRGEEYQRLWIDQIKNLAQENQVSTKNIYPNAGIIVGTAKNILNAYNILGMKETEDDQALFTELLLKQADLIVMDYEQKLIGNNIWTHGMDGCIFEWDDKERKFVHPENKNSPAFLHFQGKFYECYGKMASKFGYNGDMTRKLAETGFNNYNYNYQATVKYTQELKLLHTMTLSEANAAVDQLNTNKGELCTAISHESAYADATCEDAVLVDDHAQRLIRRLSHAESKERVIKFPFIMEGDEKTENDLITELQNWAISTPTKIATKADLHGGQSFQASITSPRKYQQSSSLMRSLSIFLAVALCIYSMVSNF